VHVVLQALRHEFVFSFVELEPLCEPLAVGPGVEILRIFQENLLEAFPLTLVELELLRDAAAVVPNLVVLLVLDALLSDELELFFGFYFQLVNALPTPKPRHVVAA